MEGNRESENMREHLTINMRNEKMLSYDNPAMVYDGAQSEMKLRKNSTAHGPHDSTANFSKADQMKNVFIPHPNAYKTQKSVEKEYEPYDNRVVKRPTTYMETLIHMLKASLGTGILAMPQAFHKAGLAVATIGTIAIGLLCTYTIHVLISTEYELCKRKKKPCMTYPETAQAAVSEGPKSLRKISSVVPHICNVFLLLYQIGSCCIYVVFITQNIKDVVDYYYPKTDYDIKLYMLMILLPLLLINYVGNLKFLAPLSTLANLVTVVSFGIIFYYMFDHMPSINSVPAVAPFEGMPLFFGTVLFAMEAIGVVMPLENEMKNPRKFGTPFGVLNCAMVPITLLYTFVGFFGYVRYRSGVHDSITLDLPREQILAQCAKLSLAFAIFITHAIACYVAIDICWREYLAPKIKTRKLLAEYILRTVIVLITIAMAAAIPDLHLFISLIGALCLSTMGLSFPALMQLFTYWYEYNGVRFVLFFLKNLAIILISLLGFGVGTYTSLDEIIRKFVFHEASD